MNVRLRTQKACRSVKFLCMGRCVARRLQRRFCKRAGLFKARQTRAVKKKETTRRTNMRQTTPVKVGVSVIGIWDAVIVSDDDHRTMMYTVSALSTVQ